MMLRMRVTTSAGFWGAIVCIAATLAAGAQEPKPSSGGSSRQTPNPLFDNPARCSFRHHAVEAFVDPIDAHLRARDEILLVHAPGVPLDAKTPFLLNRSLQIAGMRASSGGQELEISWREHERWQPRDFWADPEYGELAELGHARQVDLFLDAMGAFSSWPETLLVEIEYDGTVYDTLRSPPENYQRGFETTTGLIDARGAFLAGGTLWYPQRFDEPFSFCLTVEVPAGWMAVSQGRRAEPSDLSGRHLVVWDSPEPMEEIYLIAGPYHLREKDYHGVAIQTYTYGNDDAELCERYLGATHDYLAMYEDLIGPYPFAKFALVENFWQTGYGMPSFTLLGDRVVRLPFILHTSYGHEILHNWWGNGVFVDFESGNWCEGLTVYGADYLYKERESEAAAREYRRTQLQGYLDYVGSGRDFALTEFRARHDNSSAAIGYGKAMMLCHMLRRRLGDERFWHALSEFYHAYLFQVASWHDLLGAMAHGGGLDVEAFHDQWIARAGAPVLSLAEADLTAQSGGRYELTYVIKQEEPRYALHVPVRVTYADRPPEDWTVSLRSGSFGESRRLPAKPTTLEVDPDFDLFRRLHRAEVPTALSQLFGADTLTAVLPEAAAEDLGAAYAEVAEQSGRGRPTGTVRDTEVAIADLSDCSVWILGEPRWRAKLATLLPPGTRLEPERFTIAGETYDRSAHTLVLALPHPENPDEAIGLFLASGPGDVAAVWRKLPHYGKYSYLVFEGARNVAKGTWPIGRSPLKVIWDTES